MRRVVLLLSVLVCLPLLASAQAYYIPVPSGGDIQAAINQAAGYLSGPNPKPVIIEVAAGTYIPQLGQTLDVSGINSPTHVVRLRSVDGPAVTIIDGSYKTNVLMFGVGTQNLIIEGFTFRNRTDPYAGFNGRGIRFVNATNITIQDCHFDTLTQSIRFQFDASANPDVLKMSPHFEVIHNTAVGGHCPDPLSDPCFTGQPINLEYVFPEGTLVTGEPKLIVADNVLRAVGSPVRFLAGLTDPNGVMVQSLPNGSLIMTGNNVTSLALGAGHNVIGGRGHYVAGNVFHDGHIGAAFQIAGSYTFENNLVYGNGQGVIVNEGDTGVTPPAVMDRRYIRHNTIVNNRGVGIVYQDGNGGEHLALPNVYNNIIAFNDAGGVAAAGDVSGEYRVIPVDFQMARNNLYGNTLRNINLEHDWFSYVGITNPEAIKTDYTGVINAGQDLSVVLGFMSAEDLDFVLKKNSPLRDMGLTTRPTPLRDFFGAIRDAKPDIGAAEVVPMPNVNLRSNPMRKGPPPID